MTTSTGNQYARGNWMDAMAWMDAGKMVKRVGSGRRLKRHPTTNGFGQYVLAYFCQFEKDEEGALSDWTDWHEYTLTYDDVHATDWQIATQPPDSSDKTMARPSPTLPDRIQALIAALQAFAREQEEIK